MSIVRRVRRAYRKAFPGSSVPGALLTVGRALGVRTALTIEIGGALLAVAGFLGFQSLQDFPTIYLVAGLASWLVVWLPLAGLLALRGLTPDEWAYVQLERRGVAHALRASAALAHAILEEFHVASEGDSDLFISRLPFDMPAIEGMELIQTIKSVWGKKAVRRRSIVAVERCLASQFSSLRRLEALARRAAAELRVPPSRYFDYMLDLEPRLYEELIRKYVENWREIDAGLDRLTGDDMPRVMGIMRENRHTRKILETRIDRFSELEKFSVFADVLVPLVSARSTSTTVRRYAHALVEASSYSTNTVQRGEALRFIYRKRRIHAGLDPHDLLTAICEASGHASLKNALVALRGEVDQDTPQVDDFDKLRFFAARHMHQAHNGIAKQVAAHVEKFRQELEGKNQSAQIYIYTIGFSRVVRQAVAQYEEKGDARWPVGHVLLPIRVGSDSLQTRVMQHQLRREAKRQHGHGKDVMFTGVSTARFQFAFHAPKSGDGVVLLIGCKGWSPDGRVICDRGYASIVDQVVRERKYGTGFGDTGQKDVGTLVLALAEKYKRVEDLPEHSSFYGDADDQIELLRGGIDFLITDTDHELLDLRGAQKPEAGNPHQDVNAV